MTKTSERLFTGISDALPAATVSNTVEIEQLVEQPRVVEQSHPAGVDQREDAQVDVGLGLSWRRL